MDGTDLVCPDRAALVPITDGGVLRPYTRFCACARKDGRYRDRCICFLRFGDHHPGGLSTTIVGDGTTLGPGFASYSRGSWAGVLAIPHDDGHLGVNTRYSEQVLEVASCPPGSRLLNTKCSYAPKPLPLTGWDFGPVWLWARDGAPTWDLTKAHYGMTCDGWFYMSTDRVWIALSYKTAVTIVGGATRTWTLTSRSDCGTPTILGRAFEGTVAIEGLPDEPPKGVIGHSRR